MQRALLVAHQFPPVGGGGVQRSVKFVRYMPEFGYEPVVITGPGTAIGRWRPQDPTLTRQIGHAELIRVPGPEPGASVGWRRRAERLLDRETPFAKWWTAGVREAASAVAGSVDVIVATLGPYVTASAAVDVAGRFDKPLVLDFRDPWALDEVWLYTSYVHRARDRARMRRALVAAAAVVMNTQEAAARVVEHFPELHGKLVTWVPSGFDPGDFDGPAPIREDGKFRIVHAGGLYAELGLSHRRTKLLRRVAGGFPVAGVDLLPRSHLVLLEAIDRLLGEEPDLADVIEVRLAGVMSEFDRRIAEASPVVRIEGFRSHQQTVALLRSADLLFLPMHDLPSGTRAGLVPGKTYEYLAAGRPILAAVPEGDARDMLIESDAALLCLPSDAAAMAAAISSEIQRWRRGAEPRRPKRELVERYRWHSSMKQLAGVMDAVAGPPAAEVSA